MDRRNRKTGIIEYIVASIEFGKRPEYLTKELGVDRGFIDRVVADYKNGYFKEVGLKVKKRRRFCNLLKVLLVYQSLHLVSFLFVFARPEYGVYDGLDLFDLLVALNPRLGLFFLDDVVFGQSFFVPVLSALSILLLGISAWSLHGDLSGRGRYRLLECILGGPSAFFLVFLSLFYVFGSGPPDFGGNVREFVTPWVVFFLFSTVPFVLSFRVPVFKPPRRISG